MELLIPGLILVALMVYASTRIKKSAAKAYESETIETDDFVIFKPAGFLTVVGGDPRYAFEAYSKEFGSDSASDIRQAIANISIDDAEKVIPSDGEIPADRTEHIDGRSYRITETDRMSGGIPQKVLRKSFEHDGRTVTLEIVFLKETTDQFTSDIESMLQSFRSK